MVHQDLSAEYSILLVLISLRYQVKFDLDPYIQVVLALLCELGDAAARLASFHSKKSHALPRL